MAMPNIRMDKRSNQFLRPETTFISSKKDEHYAQEDNPKTKLYWIFIQFLLACSVANASFLMTMEVT